MKHYCKILSANTVNGIQEAQDQINDFFKTMDRSPTEIISINQIEEHLSTGPHLTTTIIYKQ